MDRWSLFFTAQTIARSNHIVLFLVLEQRLFSSIICIKLEQEKHPVTGA
jgi:hypothetical protein